jgi:hypothetical protein
MPNLFDKMNLKDQHEIVVLNAPDSFEPELAALKGLNIVRDAGKAKKILFGLAFAVTRDELDNVSQTFARKAEGDAVLWFAYPKGSSRRYQCEFNRDSGWDVMREAGFDSVRMVAIDEDWSALRFRRVEFIKAK